MVEYEKDAVVKPYVTGYIRSILKKRTGFLGELEAKAAADEVPILQPESSKFLETVVMMKRPEKILEIGCAVGYSAIVMAKAYEKSVITTLEFNEDFIPVAKSNIEKEGLSDRINVVYADARDYVSYLEEDEVYDMIFLDGPKAHYVNMIDDCMRILKPGGVIVSDNILYKGMTATDELVIKRKITIVKRLRKFLEDLTGRKDAETAVLSIGDGMTVTVKK